MEIRVDRSKALRGASEALVLFDLIPTLPTTANSFGSQSWFEAATAIRPATNEFPRREPATTRQTRIAAMIPKAGPRRRVIAVLWISTHVRYFGFESTHHGDRVSDSYHVPRKEDVVSCIGGDEAQYNCRKGGVDGQRKLTSWC